MRDVSSNTPVVSIVNDDESVREALKGFIQSIGFRARDLSVGRGFPGFE
jgi:FixJ family two-component response regulator